MHVGAGSMNDLEHLLAGLDAHPAWTVVLLFPNSKLPAARKGGPGQVTIDRDRVVIHVRHGGNIGLKAGVSADLVIHDIDNAIAYAELWDLLGPLTDATVCTASGKLHAWTQWVPGVPARLMTPAGEVVGEPRRGGVPRSGRPETTSRWPSAPPSQIDGKRYRFTASADLTRALPEIPEPWRAYFARVVPKTRCSPPRHLAQCPRGSLRGGDAAARCAQLARGERS